MAELKNTVINGLLNVNGDLIASTIKKRGGTNNQILLADGSVNDALIGTVSAQGTAISTMSGTISDLQAALNGRPTEEEISGEYATKAELAAEKTNILGVNDDSSNFNGTVKGAYANAAAAQSAADAANTNANTKLPLAGGTMDGLLTTSKGSSIWDKASGIKFGDQGYINGDSQDLGFQTQGNIYFRSNDTSIFIITGSAIRPHDNKKSLYDLGTNTAQFRDLYIANQIKSTVTTGTAPLTVSSTTKVDNLNADLLDGHDSTYFGTSAEIVTLQSSKLSLSGGEMTGSIRFTSKEGTNTDIALANETSEINNIVIANKGTDILTLKRVTPDIFISKLGIAKVYNYKGTVANLAALKAITSAEVGDVYNNLDDNKNYACIKKVTATTTDANFATYWQEIGSAVQLEGYATKAYVDSEVNTLLGAATNPANDTIRKAQATADNVTTAFNTFKNSSSTKLTDIDSSLNTITGTTIPGLSERIDELNKTIKALNNTYATDVELSEAISAITTAYQNADSAINNAKVNKTGDIMTGNLKLYDTSVGFITANSDTAPIAARMEYDSALKAIKFKFA